MCGGVVGVILYLGLARVCVTGEECLKPFVLCVVCGKGTLHMP